MYCLPSMVFDTPYGWDVSHDVSTPGLIIFKARYQALSEFNATLPMSITPMATIGFARLNSETPTAAITNFFSYFHLYGMTFQSHFCHIAGTPPLVTRPTITSDYQPTWSWVSSCESHNCNATFSYKFGSEDWSAPTTAKSFTPDDVLDDEMYTLRVKESEPNETWSSI